jgi:ATP-dependent DNA helicase RecQ
MEGTGSRKVTAEPLGELRRHFGFDGFLDGQREVVDQVLAGRDGLVVMPTGGGKSLCYQLPALCFEGVTLVVSPLIALMKDQVDALTAKGVPATVINSTVAWADQCERLRGMREGAWKLVYVAPERFRAGSFLAALEGVPVALFAVDEAHCLSQWGHDFRPDYLRLGRALDRLGRPQCVAFTATATPVVRDDIRAVLALRDPFELVSGFARPNLALAITHVEKAAQKFARVRAIVGEHKTGIIYCATRKKVEEVAEVLAGWGVKSVAYHGGMSDDERERAQDVFLHRAADVAVATNAFGMGIDRADVRFVIHFELPGSIEAYYQEAGRAGRDGESAVCELLFNYADTRTQEFFIEGANPSSAVIRDIWGWLRDQADANYEVHRSLEDIAGGAGVKNAMAVGSALTVLARAGCLERFDVAGRRTRGTRLLKPELAPRQLELDQEALEEKDRRDRDKLRALVEMCYARTCRQESILRYFGEQDADPCGWCDVCRGGDGIERGPTEEEDEVVRKVLSGVARMSWRRDGEWHGRYGRAKVVQMLVGSRSQEILAAGLDQLSTYGVLTNHGTNYLSALLRALHDAGLVRTETGEFPLLTLTGSGERVMRGQASYRLAWPERREKGAAAPARALPDHGFDPALYARLRDVRSGIARRDQVPPYIVFSNRTLEALTRHRPTTTDAALAVPGIGDAKAARYLRPFLDEIAAFTRAAGGMHGR